MPTNTSRLPRRPLPQVIPVRQCFDRPRVNDLAAATATALAQVLPDSARVAGKVIGLTAPSRGIREIGPVLRHLAGALRSLGAVPKILTAMGTHGGGTAEGNLETARNRGIDPERVGAEVIGDIETIGRSPYGAIQGQPWVAGTPRIFNIIGSALTPGNHGNAIGMGLCEFITERFRAAVDPEVTALNCLTALCPCQARMPIVMPNDREALATALAVSPVRQRPHLVLIHSTLNLAELLVSPGALEDSKRNGSSLEVRGEPRDIPFTADGYVGWGAEHQQATVAALL